MNSGNECIFIRSGRNDLSSKPFINPLFNKSKFFITWYSKLNNMDFLRKTNEQNLTEMLKIVSVRTSKNCHASGMNRIGKYKSLLFVGLLLRVIFRRRKVVIKKVRSLCLEKTGLASKSSFFHKNSR